MSTLTKSFITFLLGTLIFAVLPLLAWGIFDLRGFFSNSARTTYIILVLILNAYAAYRIPEVGKPQESKSKRSIERQHSAVIMMQVISFFVVLSAPFCDSNNFLVFNDSGFLRTLGIVLYIMGFLTMHLSEWYLGKYFSVEVRIREEHKLVTSGPYRYLRHPRYLGITIFLIGISLVFRSWFSLIFAFALISVLIWRIYDEEILLSSEFGEEWQSYKSKSWRLIPFIY